MSRPSSAARPPLGTRSVWRDRHFVIVASQFHVSIAKALVQGAVDVLRRAGVSSTGIRLLWVPGAFEIPVVAARAAEAHPRPHAIIALGALIRGETVQYEVLAHAVTGGLTALSVSTGIPVTNGIIVSNTLAQARARAGGPMGNRGAEAATAAVSLLQLFDALK